MTPEEIAEIQRHEADVRDRFEHLEAQVKDLRTKFARADNARGRAFAERDAINRSVRKALGLPHGTPDATLLGDAVTALRAEVEQTRAGLRALETRVQAMREDGEGDLRGVLDAVRALLPATSSAPVQHGGDTCEECETTGRNCTAHGGRPGVTPDYPAPGSAIPGQPGYVVGTCGHRLAASEWRAGCRTCERCPARRSELAVPPDDAETRIHAMWADADVEGLDLNAMTVDELTGMVMHAITRDGGDR